MKQNNWSENVILVDADYADRVTFDLIVNFERMLGRRIPQADMARWIDCLALDGGIRAGDHTTHVVLIHDKGQKAMQNFMPADYENELNSKAFSDSLGEFTISALPVEAMTTKDDFLIETLDFVCRQQDVKRIMLVPDAEHIYNKVKQTIDRLDKDQALDGKRITVFAMQPMAGGAFLQEILGYSLMAALGIKGNEINPR